MTIARSCGSHLTGNREATRLHPVTFHSPSSLAAVVQDRIAGASRPCNRRLVLQGFGDLASEFPDVTVTDLVGAVESYHRNLVVSMTLRASLRSTAPLSRRLSLDSLTMSFDGLA